MYTGNGLCLYIIFFLLLMGLVDITSDLCVTQGKTPDFLWWYAGIVLSLLSINTWLSVKDFLGVLLYAESNIYLDCQPL